MTTSTSGAAPVTVGKPGSGFVEASVEVDGFTIRYWEAGQGEPLVTLHGAGGPEFSFALDLLARDRRVILIEMPGFGEQINEVHEDFDGFAATIARTIEAIGIERYHLMGTSFGGATALFLALSFPDRLISLVLDAPAAFRGGAPSPMEMAAGEAEPRFRAQPDREPKFVAPEMEKMARVMPLLGRLMSADPEFENSLTDRLPGCLVRTLVVFGDKDGVIPSDNGRIYRRLMDNCSLQYLHKAAHAAQFDRPEAYAELVGDFLTRGWLFLVPEQSSLINP
jgi:pimeloyl-ACP methyl ester carboxylesterase